MCCIEAVIMCSVLKRMNCVCGDIDVLFEGGVGSIVCAFFVSLHHIWSHRALGAESGLARLQCMVQPMGKQR